jgi:hypothetical protein
MYRVLLWAVGLSAESLTAAEYPTNCAYNIAVSFKEVMRRKFACVYYYLRPLPSMLESHPSSERKTSFRAMAHAHNRQTFQ